MFLEIGRTFPKLAELFRCTGRKFYWDLATLIVEQDSGREDIGWSDWSECTANCGTGFRWGGQRVIGQSAQTIVAQDSGRENRG